MSLCALTAARIRDGAGSGNSSSALTAIPSETYYRAVLAALPVDLNHAGHFDYKRAKSNLALLCIQYGDIRGLHRHLGDYLSLCSMDGFHLESRWPGDIDTVEVEERRRLVGPYSNTLSLIHAVLGNIPTRRVRILHMGLHHPTSRIRNDSSLPCRSPLRSRYNTRRNHPHRCPSLPIHQPTELYQGLELCHRHVSYP